MKRKFVLYPLLATICFCCSARPFAQKNAGTLTGKATYQTNGQPLIGSAVSVKGANPSVAVNANGNFPVIVPANATRAVDYIGCGTREIKAGSRSSPCRDEQTFGGLKLRQKF